MADRVFRGDEFAVRHVKTLTPGVGTAGGQFYDVTINTKRIRYTTVGADTVQVIVEGLVALLSAATAPPEFLRITWTEDNTKIIATAVTAGVEIPTITLATTSPNAWSQAEPTANAGPEVWSAANFGGTLPGGAVNDDVFVQDTSRNIKYNLNQSGISNAVRRLEFPKSYTGNLGLPRINSDNTNLPFFEPLDRYLRILASKVKIGHGQGAGSRRLMLNLKGNVGSKYVEVHGSAPEGDAGHAPIRLLMDATGSSPIVDIFNGIVDIGMEDDETSAIGTLRVSGNAIVRIGPGVTLTNLYTGGNAQVTYDLRAGDLSILETADKSVVNLLGGKAPAGTVRAISTRITVESGTVYFMTEELTVSGPAVIGAGGIMDFTKMPGSGGTISMVTFSGSLPSLIINPKGQLIDPAKRAKFTNKIRLSGGFEDVKLILGRDLDVDVNRD